MCPGGPVEPGEVRTCSTILRSMRCPCPRVREIGSYGAVVSSRSAEWQVLESRPATFPPASSRAPHRPRGHASALEEWFKRFVGSDRRWSGLHRNLRSLSRIARRLRIGQDAEHHARIRNHDDWTRSRLAVIAASVSSGPQLDGLRSAASRARVAPPWLADARKPCGEPVGLTARVVVCGESESFEPPRGSGAHVSERIVAVHDDRSLPIERVHRGGGGEHLEGQIDRRR